MRHKTITLFLCIFPLIAYAEESKNLMYEYQEPPKVAERIKAGCSYNEIHRTEGCVSKTKLKAERLQDCKLAYVKVKNSKHWLRPAKYKYQGTAECTHNQ